MIIQFRKNKKPRFVIKDERWWVDEEHELLNLDSEENIDKYQRDCNMKLGDRR